MDWLVDGWVDRWVFASSALRGQPNRREVFDCRFGANPIQRSVSSPVGASMYMHVCMRDREAQREGNHIVWDNAMMMQELWKMIFCITRARATSMSRYSDECPGLLAGMVHTDGAIVRHTLQVFKQHVEAYRAACSKTGRFLQDAVRRHPLSGTAVRFAEAFAAAASFDRVTPQMQDHLLAMFAGWGQTKVVEDTIQKLRDHEQRDSSSKEVCRMQSWENMVSHRVMEQYGRVEIQPTSNATMPNTFGDNLFHPAVVRPGEVKQGKLDLDKILAKVDWVSHSAQSQQNNVAISQLLLHLHQGGSWDFAAQSWKASIMPEGCLIMHTSDPGDEFMVLILGLGGDRECCSVGSGCAGWFFRDPTPIGVAASPTRFRGSFRAASHRVRLSPCRASSDPQPRCISLGEYSLALSLLAALSWGYMPSCRGSLGRLAQAQM